MTAARRLEDQSATNRTLFHSARPLSTDMSNLAADYELTRRMRQLAELDRIIPSISARTRSTLSNLAPSPARRVSDEKISKTRQPILPLIDHMSDRCTWIETRFPCERWFILPTLFRMNIIEAEVALKELFTSRRARADANKVNPCNHRWK